MATAERPINVYRVQPLTLWVAVFVALVLQAFLPVVLPAARLLDLPLLVVIYFSAMRRSKVFGTLLGAAVGLAEDALSHGYLGMFGIAKTLVGYFGAWASVQFDLEQFAGRLALTTALVLFHGLAMVGLRQALLEPPPAFQLLDFASVALFNIGLAAILFELLDRFRRPA